MYAPPIPLFPASSPFATLNPQSLPLPPLPSHAPLLTQTQGLDPATCASDNGITLPPGFKPGQTKDANAPASTAGVGGGSPSAHTGGNKGGSTSVGGSASHSPGYNATATHSYSYSLPTPHPPHPTTVTQGGSTYTYDVSYPGYTSSVGGGAGGGVGGGAEYSISVVNGGGANGKGGEGGQGGEATVTEGAGAGATGTGGAVPFTGSANGRMVGKGWVIAVLGAVGLVF